MQVYLADPDDDCDKPTIYDTNANYAQCASRQMVIFVDCYVGNEANVHGAV